MDSDIELIAHEIECYVAAHPEAADTSEGIARWWITVVDVSSDLTRVEAALELLVRDGTMRCRALPDGNCVYSR